MGKVAGRAAVCAAVVLWAACGGSSTPPPPDEPGRDAGTTPTPSGDAGIPGDDDGGDPGPDGGAPTDGGTVSSRICVPGAGGPYWRVEGEAVTFTVSCSTGWSDPASRFEITNLPEGAVLDSATGAFSWTPALHQAATYELILRETTTGETATVKVGVADRFESQGNTPVKDPARYTEEFGLPVMHLSFEGKLSKEFGPAQLIYRGKTYLIEAKYRGATSMDFPKRSFTLKFPDTDEFRDDVLGVGNRDKLALVTTFNDNSYVRPRLAFEVWKLMDPGHLSVKEHFSTVVFVNGRYWGVYSAMDTIDSDLMRRHDLNKEGQLFKSFHADANFSGFTQEGVEKWAYWQGYEKKEGLPEVGKAGAMDEISDLTEFVATSTDAEFRSGLPERVTIKDYEDWWIFVSMILGTDNGGKNAYHYRDDTGGGRFRFIPWDLDATFGQAFDTTRTSAQWRNDFAGQNLMFKRMLADPSMIGPVRERYEEMLRSVVTKEKVLAIHDALQAEVEGAAKRDEVRWTKEYRSFERWNTRGDFTTYEQEQAYLRAWISDRWDALERQLP